jgi:hypothetical protein
MTDLAEVEAGSCPGCGFHESLMEGDEHVFGPVDRVCPVCAGKAQWDRVLHHSDDLERERLKSSAPATPHASDGRWTHMTILSPEEIARRGGPGGNTP